MPQSAVYLAHLGFQRVHLIRLLECKQRNSLFQHILLQCEVVKWFASLINFTQPAMNNEWGFGDQLAHEI